MGGRVSARAKSVVQKMTKRERKLYFFIFLKRETQHFYCRCCKRGGDRLHSVDPAFLWLDSARDNSTTYLLYVLFCYKYTNSFSSTIPFLSAVLHCYYHNKTFLPRLDRGIDQFHTFKRRTLLVRRRSFAQPAAASPILPPLRYLLK